jgi:4-hydroxy-tetrahydrodipicolinate reductase
MPSIRVAVSGAAGRMGRAAVRAVSREADMRLVAAIGRERDVGRDAGDVAGTGRLNVAIEAEFGAVMAAAPHVLVEFAPGRPALEHARAALTAGLRPVIGSTGIAASEIEALGALAAERKTGAVVAPNFAIGAVLMMEFARVAARHMPHVEIIELHHDRKRDAPSGTAVKTARVIAEARGTAPPPAVREEELVPGARGVRARASGSTAYVSQDSVRTRRLSSEDRDRRSPSVMTPSMRSRSCPACCSPFAPCAISNGWSTDWSICWDCRPDGSISPM